MMVPFLKFIYVNFFIRNRIQTMWSNQFFKIELAESDNFIANGMLVKTEIEK